MKLVILRLATVTVTAATFLGCGESGGGDETGMIGSTGEGSSGPGTTSSGAGTVGDGSGSDGNVDEGSSGGDPEVPSCEFPGAFSSYSAHLPDPQDQSDVANVDILAACNYPELIAGPGTPGVLEAEEDDFDVYVYRPADPQTGDWPAGAPPHPAIFFVSGRGMNTYDPGAPQEHMYAPVFTRLAEAGFVVFAAQSNPTWFGPERRAGLACMMLWARDTSSNGWVEAGANRVGNAAVLMGHSQGGAGSLSLTNSMLCLNEPNEGSCCLDGGGCEPRDDLPGGTVLDDWEVCATVGIAPEFKPSDATDVSIEHPNAPPYLMINGSLDEDTRGHGAAAYDQNVREELLTGPSSPSARLFDKVATWVYGPSHRAWGGVFGDFLGRDQSDAAGPYYITSFLRWQVLHDSGAREAFMTPADPGAANPDFEPEIRTAALWNTDGRDQTDPNGDGVDVFAPNLKPFYDGANLGGGVTLEGLGRPLVLVDYTQGTGPAGADRYVVDTATRAGGGLTCFPSGLGPSTAGGSVTATMLGAQSANVCRGAAEELTDLATLDHDVHATDALRVDWGGANVPGVEIVWSLADAGGAPLTNVSDYTHLSLRIANLVEVSGSDCIPAIDEFSVEVELVSEGPAGTVVSAPISTGTTVDQHVEPSPHAIGGEVCASSQFMHTVRIPLSDFCSASGGSVVPDALTGIRVRFPAGEPELRRALVDSIEFTRDPTAVQTPICPQATSAWNCVASAALLPVETSCTVEPAPGCPPGKLQTNLVSVPWAEGPAGGGHSGWVAHIPKGSIANPQSPSPSAIDEALTSCVAACQLEWSDNPDVAANCGDPNAFLTPTLRATPSVGPVHRIPTGFEHGAGLFANQALACNLEGDCCEGFDEDMCAARSTRTSPAGQRLGRGEQYRVTLGGAGTSATWTTPKHSVAMAMVGHAGYSYCAEDSADCPFYLGSMSLSSTQAVTVADTCADGSALTHQVSDLDIELVQPAFGISEGATSIDRAFPAGALHLRGYVAIDGQSYTVRSVNEDPVYVSARDSDIFSVGLDVDLDVPCGTATMPVTLQIDAARLTVDASPPTATITTPSQVACPGPVALTVNASDPDDDLASLRWAVDDVLLAPGTSSIGWTTDHTLRAIVRDARGATAVRTKQVGCL